MRFRGNSSYRMVPTGFKRSLNLSLDSTHPDQQVGGYHTLNLLNANSDPTFVRTVLYAEIARNYLAVPKVNFVHVVINGESWGIYLNAQQFNKDLLRDAFGTTKGVRWKVPGSPRGRGGLEYLGDSLDSYKALYELKSKDTEKSVDRSRPAVPAAEHDRSRTPRGGAGPAPRHRRRAEVPGARDGVREHRRLLDAGQRLQPVRE